MHWQGRKDPVTGGPVGWGTEINRATDTSSYGEYDTSSKKVGKWVTRSIVSSGFTSYITSIEEYSCSGDLISCIQYNESGGAIRAYPVGEVNTNRLIDSSTNGIHSSTLASPI